MVTRPLPDRLVLRAHRRSLDAKGGRAGEARDPHGSDPHEVPAGTLGPLRFHLFGVRSKRVSILVHDSLLERVASSIRP